MTENIFSQYDDDEDSLVITPPQDAGTNPFSSFDDDPVEPDPAKQTVSPSVPQQDDWYKPLADRKSQETARESSRVLTEAERKSFGFEQPQTEEDASFWGSLEHGLGNRNIEAYADTLDHLADMSDDPSYSQSYRDWSGSLRKTVQEDGSTYKPVFQSYKQINGLADAWGYVKEVAGEQIGIQLPGIVGAIGGGYLGQKVGAPLGKVGRAAGGFSGATAGALSGMIHHHVSEMRNALKREKIEGADLVKYTNYGTMVLAGLDLAFPVVAGLKFNGPVRQAISRKIALQLAKGGTLRAPSEFIKRFGKEIVKDAILLEVPTEIAQEAVTTFVPPEVAGREVTDEEIQRFVTETVPETALRTAIGAGGITAPGSALQARRDVQAGREIAADRDFAAEAKAAEQSQQVARETKEDQIEVQQPVEEAQEAQARPEPPEAVETQLERTSLAPPAAELSDIEDVRQWAKEKYGENAKVSRYGKQYSIGIEADGVIDYVTPAGGISEAQLAELGYGQRTEETAVGLAPEQQAYEQEAILPAIEEIDAEVGSPVLSEAYSRLTPDEKTEIISRISENEEDIAVIANEIASRGGLTEEQIAQVGQIVQERVPEVVEAVEQIVGAQTRQAPTERQTESAMPEPVGIKGAFNVYAIPADGSKPYLSFISEMGEASAHRNARANRRFQSVPVSGYEFRTRDGKSYRFSYDEPSPTGSEEQTTGQPAQPDRRQFASILNSRTPRSKWASELGIDEASLEPLIEEAIRKGFLRRDKNGNVRRVPKSQRSGSFAAMAIPENLPDTLPGEGDVALTPEAEEGWPEVKAAINRAASAILPDAVKVDVVDNIAIATLKKEDQRLALRKTKPSESAIDEDASENRVDTGREGVETVEGQPAPGGTTVEGESLQAPASDDLGTGLPDRALARIIRQESASLDADGNIIAGRPSRQAKASRKGGEGQPIQRAGKVEPFDIAGFEGRARAEKLTDRDAREGNLARLTYEVREPGSKSAIPLGEMEITQRSDGAWEVGYVEIRAPRNGIGTKLYDAVEKDLGVRMSPSGVLSESGHAFWQKRSPASVQWHVKTPTFTDEAGKMYFSPRKITDEMDRIGRELKNLSAGSGRAMRIPAAEREELRKALVKERGKLIALYGKLPLEARAAKDQMFALRAFHGSPHDFDRFDLSRIGTGEGAQAFGSGLYFAEDELTAKAYQEQLSNLPVLDDSSGSIFSGLPWTSRTTEKHARYAMDQAIQSGLDGDNAVRRAIEILTDEGNRASASHMRQPYYDAANALGGMLGKKWKINPGQLYEVEIDVEHEQLLDYDIDLNDQPAMLEALKPLAKQMWPDLREFQLNNRLRFRDGRSFYDDLIGFTGTPQRASDALREAGIPGMRYLDQGSRDVGDGTRNIVLFDDSLVTITKKNGKPVSAEERQGVIDEMFALRGFYSPAIRAAENISQAKGTGEQFLKQITKAPGVRKDELEWMGLEEFLKDKKSVTKDEVLSFMRAHQVELDERVMGDTVTAEKDLSPISSEEVLSKTKWSEDWFEQAEAIWSYRVGDQQYYITKNDDPQDGPYSLFYADGNQMTGEPTNLDQARHMLDGVYGDEQDDPGLTKFADYKVPGGENYRELLIRLPELEGKFQSPHFQDQEIVHLRVDDRTGPNGEKVLFINEVQSDLLQTARRFGFGPEGYAKAKAVVDGITPENIRAAQEHIAKEQGTSVEDVIENYGYAMESEYIRLAVEEYQFEGRIDADGEPLTKAEQKRLAAAERYIRDFGQKGAPKVPFTNDTAVEIALKRALLYAAENGYDAVSWARSDQAAKAVGADPEDLALQYDRNMGRFLSKYTKKWGGKVEKQGGIADERIKLKPQEILERLPEDDVAKIRTAANERGITGELSNLRPRLIAQLMDEAGVDSSLAYASNSILRITPEMRSSVMEGQPLAMRRQPSAIQPQALGQTDPYKMQISIAMQAVEAEAKAKGVTTAQEAVRVLRHEAVEFFKGIGLFTEKEWNVLKTAAKRNGWVETTGVRESYESVYKGGMTETEMNDLLIKEAIAEQYSEFHLGKKQFKGVVAEVFQRIKDFIDRTASFMRGEGFQTWEDVFERIDEGEFKARFEEAFPEMVPQQPQGEVAPVVRAGQVPDAPGFSPAPGASGPVQGLSDIINDFKRTLGMTVRQGRLDPNLKRQMAATPGGGRVLGQFGRNTGVTRVEVSNDIDTLAHEGGHHLESMFGASLDGLKSRFDAELLALSSPGPDALSEGFAEFFRRYVTNPAAAKAKAPGFFDAFEDFLDAENPKMLEQLQAIQQGYIEMRRGDPTEVKIANQTTLVGRDNSFTEFMKDAEANGVIDTMSDRLHQLYFNMIGSNHGFWLATKRMLDLIAQRTGKRLDIRAIDNPNKLLRRVNHSTAWAMQDLKNGVSTRARPNGGGVSMHDVLRTAFGGEARGQWNEQALKQFGDYLISRRAVHLYVRHLPQFRNDVIAFVQANPQLQYLLPRLPTNTESTLENPPTLEPLNLHLKSLLDHETRNPNFQQAAEMYYEFNRDMLTLLHEKGLLTDEELANLSQDNDYAPFQRDMSDRELVSGSEASRRGGSNAAMANKFSVMQAIKGSTRDIINPIQSTVQFVYEQRLRIALNDTLVAMDRLAKAAGAGGGAIFERLPEREAKGYTVQIQQALKNAAKDAGMSDQDTTWMIANVEQYLGNNATTVMFTQGQAKEKGERIVWFYEQGKPVPARLADGTLGRMMFEGFTMMGKRSADRWMKALAVPAWSVRTGVTFSFEFIFRNIFVDSLVAPINSPYAQPFITQISGMREILRGGRYQQLYNRYAGMMGGQMTQALNDQSIERDVKALRNKGFNIRRPKNLIDLAKMLFQIGEFSETATRVGIFKKAMETAMAEGMSEYEAAAEAAYASHDVIDFSMHGSKTELLRRAIPFWNAAMIGMTKYARSMTAQGDHGSAINTWLKYRDGKKLTASEKRDLRQAGKAWFYTTVVFGGMSYLFAMLNEGDEEIDEIGDRLRATHWRVSLNGILYLIPKDIRTFLNLPDKTDVVMRLPKGFETAWFANGVERALDAAKKEDPTAFNGYLNDLWEITKPPGGIPAIDLPYELMTGKSLFTGRPIIPYWEQELERQEQFGPYTSETAKTIGEAINVSPYYVDHFIRGAGASVARDIQTLIDFGVGKGPLPSIEEYPIARRFTYNTGRFSRSLEKFYDLRSDKEGFNSWFWDTVSSDARSFNAAESTYKQYVDAENEAAANQFYERLNDDQKTFATLGTHFKDSKSKYRNLHPIENASEGISIVGSLMREVYDGTILKNKGTKRESRTSLDREQMRFARNELGHIRKAFAQNALHILDVPGWENQPMMDVDKRLDTLKEAAPQVYDELIRRLDKKHFIDFRKIDRVWPEAKQRLLEDRERALLGDLFAGGRVREFNGGSAFAQ